MGNRTRGTLAAAGSEVAEGDAIAVLRHGERELAIRTPVAGTLVRTNPSLVAGSRRATAPGPVWVANLRATEAAVQRAQILWGPSAHPAYRCHLRSLRDDRGVLDSLSLDRHARWLRARNWQDLSAALRNRPVRQLAHPLPDDAAVAALAPLIAQWIDADHHLRTGLAQLGIDVRFELSDRSTGLTILARDQTAPRVTTSAAPRAALSFTLSARQLHEYLLGELDLAPALGVEVELSGSRTDAMVFTSVFQRLFAHYRRHSDVVALSVQRGLMAA